MSARLWIAAKAPRPGLAKTRLARELGEDGALALYRAMLADTGRRFARAPFDVGWYVTPEDAWDDLAPLVGADPPPRVLVQPPGDWGARQRALLAGAAARGEERTVLIASDSPHLGVTAVVRALAALDRHRLVLAPTPDGGYSLIGARGAPDPLEDIAMSTDHVTEDILARARRRGCPAALLAPTFDVDVAADLPALARLARRRRDLLAIRAALAGIGA